MSLVHAQVAEESAPWGSENDLSSLACRAAIDLDNLIIGRGTNLNGLRRLATAISTALSPSGHAADALPLNPTAVVMMNRAIHDSNWSAEPLTSVEDLVKQAQQITDSLKHLAESVRPEENRADTNSVRLRIFCLSLSKLALASERSRAPNETRTSIPEMILVAFSEIRV